MTTILIYLADFLIVGTYLLVAVGTAPIRSLHVANAGLGPVVLGGTVATVGWQPVLALTVAFTIAGWIGLFVDREDTRV